MGEWIGWWVGGWVSGLAGGWVAWLDSPLVCCLLVSLDGGLIVGRRGGV